LVATGFVLETYDGTWTSRVPVELSNGRKTVGEVRMLMSVAQENAMPIVRQD
jgi:hypothetical protein